ITCVDPRCLPAALAGREYNDDFLKALPDGVDPCGENGEFHSFAFDGPMFNRPVEFTIVETVERDGFILTDVAPVMVGTETPRKRFLASTAVSSRMFRSAAAYGAP